MTKPNFDYLPMQSTTKTVTVKPVTQSRKRRIPRQLQRPAKRQRVQRQKPPRSRRRTNNAPRSAAAKLNSGLREVALQYMYSLMDPKKNMSRIPDIDSRKTANTRSVYDFQVNVNFHDPPQADDGKFAVMVQPILGKDGPSPNTFKVAMALPGANYNTTDWTDPNSYVQELAGYDIRSDRYINQLTGSPNFFFGLNGAGTYTDGSTPFGSTPTLDPLNYGSTILYGDAGGGVDPNLKGGPGVYSLTVYMASSAPILDISPEAGTTATITPTAEQDTTGSPTGTSYIINATGDWELVITAAASPVTSWLTITPASYLGVSSWQNAGAVSEIRPVSMSALFTCSGSALNNGGMVAAACVPASTCQANWFENVRNSAVGQLQNWDALAAVDGSYSGALKDGAYTYYKPENIRNLELVDPETMNQTPYPCLMICGQMQPPNPGASSFNIGRLEVVTVYEFTTNTNLWSLESCRGFSAVYEHALDLLAGEPQAMQNGQHWEWFKDMARQIGSAALKVGQFAYENRNTIIPLAEKVAALALL